MMSRTQQLIRVYVGQQLIMQYNWLISDTTLL